jgi:type IV secretion system protein TrbJ
MGKTRKWLFAVPLLLGIGFLAVNPQRMYALWGMGDIVFDPDSYATLGDIWSSGLSTGTKIAETYNQTVQIVQNGLQMYNLGMQMAQRIKSKSVWETAAFAVGNEIARTHYNETINFSAVMNGDYLHAGQAWQQSTYYGGTGAYLGSVSAANSSRMAQFATIQMMDQASQRCATILANYNATQASNVLAEQGLKQDIFDTSDAKNSVVAALNVLSGGHFQLQNQTKANGNVQACLAEQQTLANKVQRDQLADYQTYYSDIATARGTESVQFDPTAAGNFVSGTNWTEP